MIQFGEDISARALYELDRMILFAGHPDAEITNNGRLKRSCHRSS